MARGSKCAVCGADTPPNALGKPRVTCSDPCFRAHMKEAQRAAQRARWARRKAEALGNSDPSERARSGVPCVICGSDSGRRGDGAPRRVCSNACQRAIDEQRREEEARIANLAEGFGVDPRWSPETLALILEIRSSIVTVKLATAELRVWTLWSKGLGPRPGDEVKPEPERLDGWAGYSQMHGGER